MLLSSLFRLSVTWNIFSRPKVINFSVYFFHKYFSTLKLAISKWSLHATFFHDRRRENPLKVAGCIVLDKLKRKLFEMSVDWLSSSKSKQWESGNKDEKREKSSNKGANIIVSVQASDISIECWQWRTFLVKKTFSSKLKGFLLKRLLFLAPHCKRTS
jgi:hypothetical protein